MSAIATIVKCLASTTRAHNNQDTQEDACLHVACVRNLTQSHPKFKSSTCCIGCRLTLSRRFPPLALRPSVLRCGLAEDPDLDLMLKPLCLGGMVTTFLPTTAAAAVAWESQGVAGCRCGKRNKTRSPCFLTHERWLTTPPKLRDFAPSTQRAKIIAAVCDSG